MYLWSALVAGALAYVVDGISLGEAWGSSIHIWDAVYVAGAVLIGSTISDRVFTTQVLLGDSRIIPALGSGVALGAFDKFAGPRFGSMHQEFGSGFFRGALYGYLGLFATVNNSAAQNGIGLSLREWFAKN